HRRIGQAVADNRPIRAQRDSGVGAGEHADIGGDVQSVESVGLPLVKRDEVVHWNVREVAADIGPGGSGISGLENVTGRRAAAAAGPESGEGNVGNLAGGVVALAAHGGDVAPWK